MLLALLGVLLGRLNSSVLERQLVPDVCRFLGDGAGETRHGQIPVPLSSRGFPLTEGTLGGAAAEACHDQRENSSDSENADQARRH